MACVIHIMRPYPIAINLKANVNDMQDGIRIELHIEEYPTVERYLDKPEKEAPDTASDNQENTDKTADRRNPFQWRCASKPHYPIAYSHLKRPTFLLFYALLAPCNPPVCKARILLPWANSLFSTICLIANNIFPEYTGSMGTSRYC